MKRNKKNSEIDNKNIFCIGHASFDMTFPVDEYPREGEKIKTSSKMECGGGTASNACALLALWNMSPYFIGAVGDDYFGDRVIGALDNYGVETKYLDQIENAHTSTSFVIIAHDTGKRTITTFKDPNLYLAPREIKEQADYILCDGEHLEVTHKLMDQSPQAIKVIDASFAKKGTLTLCYAMDYIICSRFFAEQVSEKKINIKKKDTIKKVYDLLVEKFNTNVIITLSEKGSYTKIDDEYKLIPSISVNVVDPTGAGDAFRGAFLYFLSKDYQIEKAIYLANITGALTTTEIGGRFSFPKLEKVLEYDK